MAETTTVAFDIEPYEKGKLLGKGGFGFVYLYELKKGRDVPHGGCKQVAVKSLLSGKQEKEKVCKEVDIMCKLRHKNVVQYLGTHEESDHHDHVLIVLEYMPGGSVRDQLKKSGAFSEEKTKRYTRDVLQGLSYLHGKNKDKKVTIHRDIKGANVLLDRIDDSINGEGTAKLADFGLSKILDTNKSAHTFGGTCRFMSPEMIDTKYVGTGHGEKTDIWSIGCVVVQMLSSVPPWKRSLTNYQVMKAIENCTTLPDYTLPDDTSKVASEFIERCFIIEPKDRPSADDLLSDPFLDKA